ncbi:MAG: tRNA (adenosine(37)-N6)-threonylcarbamoyltransferase complex ATPase subunit type 1 TsaE [Synergistaceae bacterium]|nr:tRNA (adenosine(37)-N6)-threonylcarbamoyltransferase complex ATPase subunit type 1 TsaE [Synergistaceae bacterium]
MSKPALRCKFPSVASRSPDSTSEIGRVLAVCLYPGLCVLLNGDLGSGKTLLARAMGAAMGVSRMKSPTFTIEAVHKIPGRDFSLLHCDLYRIDTPSSGDEAVFSSIEERLASGDLALIEWGERWNTPPDSDRWDISISISAELMRSFGLRAFGRRAAAALSEAYAGILDSAAMEARSR